MSTAQKIIDGGFAKSAASRPDTMASPAELLARIGQCLGEMFQVIGRENPYMLGKRLAVNYNGTGWPRPADCTRVLDVRADSGTISVPLMTPGTELKVVPYDDQQLFLGSPSITELGQVFVSTGQAIDPSAGTLTFTYARAATIPATVGDAIDPLFPAFLDDLLQHDLAAYLATKDQRAEDETAFLGFKNALVQQLIDWARAQTYSLVQRFPSVTPPLTNTDGGRQQPEQK